MLCVAAGLGIAGEQLCAPLGGSFWAGRRKAVRRQVGCWRALSGGSRAKAFGLLLAAMAVPLSSVWAARIALIEVFPTLGTSRTGLEMADAGNAFCGHAILLRGKSEWRGGKLH
jgi:hypothetical protein